jgi:hypothetical protein
VPTDASRQAASSGRIVNRVMPFSPQMVLQARTRHAGTPYEREKHCRSSYSKHVGGGA